MCFTGWALLIYCMPIIRKREDLKLNVWDFMWQSVLLQAEMMQTFLLCFDTANFVFAAWIYGKTKPVLLIRGVWSLISIPSSTVNNKQNGDLREVSVESFLPVSPTELQHSNMAYVHVRGNGKMRDLRVTFEVFCRPRFIVFYVHLNTPNINESISSCANWIRRQVQLGIY